MNNMKRVYDLTNILSHDVKVEHQGLRLCERYLIHLSIIYDEGESCLPEFLESREGMYELDKVQRDGHI